MVGWCGPVCRLWQKLYEAGVVWICRRSEIEIDGAWKQKGWAQRLSGYQIGCKSILRRCGMGYHCHPVHVSNMLNIKHDLVVDESTRLSRSIHDLWATLWLNERANLLKIRCLTFFGIIYFQNLQLDWWFYSNYFDPLWSHFPISLEGKPRTLKENTYWTYPDTILSFTIFITEYISIFLKITYPRKSFLKYCKWPFTGNWKWFSIKLKPLTVNTHSAGFKIHLQVFWKPQSHESAPPPTCHV